MVTWRLESPLVKGGGAKKRVQYCLNPNSPNQFLYLRAIQGHLGESAIDLALQDNVLLPAGFPEYIYHVGNASEMNSLVRSGSILEGRSLKRGRQTVFTNPMEDVNGMEETPCDLTKPRIAPYKNTWKRFQIRHTGAILQHTTCHLHWESGMYENTGGALPEGSLDSKSATGKTQIELAIRSTKSKEPRRKIILGPIKRFEELLRNL